MASTGEVFPVPKSHLNLNLDTNNGFYHWGLAVSQGSINNFLKKAYHKTTLLQNIDRTNHRGSIQATLAAPCIMFPGDAQLNLSKVFYQISFVSGTLKSGENGSPIKLDGWKIIVQCDLDTRFVTLKKSPSDNEEDKREREFVIKEFQIGEDNHVERLYIKLAGAGLDIIRGQSRIINPKTGKECSLGDWENEVYDDDTDTPDDSPRVFREFIRLWAKSIEKECFTTLGVNICQSIQTENPSYSPIRYFKQIFPYHDENGMAETSFNAKGNANCLIHLGMAQNQPFPQSKQLSSSGNFCSPAVDSVPAVNGTLILGRQLIWDKFLLPQLQKLNEATALHLAIWDNGSLSYEVGRRTDDSRAYEFKRTQDNRGYVYQGVAKPPTQSVQGLIFPDGELWYQPEHWSTSSTTLSWESGKATVSIKGAVEYCRGVKVSGQQDMSSSTNYHRDLHISSWEIHMSILIKDGILTIALENSPVLYEYPAIMSGVRKDIVTAIQKTIPVIAESLKIDVANSLPVYWGAGLLQTSAPVFDSEGDVIVTVDWKP